MLEGGPTTIFLSGKRGVVSDTQFRGEVEPCDNVRRAVRGAKAQGSSRLAIQKPQIRIDEGGGTVLTFEPGDRKTPCTIQYKDSETAFGGNTYNTAVAYQTTLEAFDTYGAHIASTLFHTEIVSRALRDELERVFGDRQFAMPQPPVREPMRLGWYLPEEKPKSGANEHFYLSHTPQHAPINYDLPGTKLRGKTYVISSTEPSSKEWKQLIEAKNQDPTTAIVVSPGRNQMSLDLEREVLEKVDLIAFNMREAKDFLGRVNPQLLAYVENEGKNGISNYEIAKLLAKAVCIMGPKSALVTNGGYSVAFYSSQADQLTSVDPPRVLDLQDLIRQSIGKTLPDQEVSFIGCGDTLLGVFLALQKLEKSGQTPFSTQEQLQIAVNIARYHGWSSKPNIQYLGAGDFQKIADHSAKHVTSIEA
ncbi:hypothetical protein KAZ92_00570 [Candidatus Gracilibacteria bacterium]|nr:hypothetical protein [Candidatus Gracilibacteria bacterium]